MLLPVKEVPPSAGPTPPARFCYDDEFFVDVADDAPAVPPNFRDDYAALASTRLNQALKLYLLDNQTVTAEVRPVFGEREITKDGRACLAHDGHLRFFRVRIGLGEESTSRTIPPALMCLVIETLRQSAIEVASRPPSGSETCEGCCCRRSSRGTASTSHLCYQSGDLRTRPWTEAFGVGRSCPVATLDAGWSTEDLIQRDPAIASKNHLLDWHLNHIGAAGRGIGLLRSGETNLVLIDSGVADGGPGVKHTASRARATPNITFEDPEVRDPHGTLMAQLVAETGARVKLHSIRVIDQTGTGRTAAVASAIESAVFDIPSPRIINLSLGWPPEWSDRRPLTGVGRNSSLVCKTHEDAVGGAVKFAAALAHYDPRPSQRSLVIAATGNRAVLKVNPDVPLPARSTAAEKARIHEMFGCDLESSPCPSAQSASLFYPGQWSRDAVRIDPWTKERTTQQVVYAPGAVDHRDHRVSSTRPTAATPIEAPGQAVYARGTTSPRPRRFCPTSAAPLPTWSTPPTVHYPEPITGSSVSAVLLSAVAAEAQRLWVERQGNPLRDTELLALIHASGKVLPQIDGTNRRRPMLCRIDAWISDAECMSSLTAVLSNNLTDWRIDPPAECPAVDCAHDVPHAVEVPPKASPRMCLSTTIDGIPTSTMPCAGTDCLGTQDVGIVGPQPDPTTCPTCFAYFYPGADSADLLLEFGDLYDPSATFSDFFVRYVSDAGEQIIALPNLTAVPGESMDVEISSGVTFSGEVTDAELICTVQLPEGDKFTDVSPLIVKNK